MFQPVTQAPVDSVEYIYAKSRQFLTESSENIERTIDLEVLNPDLNRLLSEELTDFLADVDLDIAEEILYVENDDMMTLSVHGFTSMSGFTSFAPERKKRQGKLKKKLKKVICDLVKDKDKDDINEVSFVTKLVDTIILMIGPGAIAGAFLGLAAILIAAIVAKLIRKGIQRFCRE